MYFKKEYYIDINEIINKDIKFYAHKNNDKKETLAEHTNLSVKYFNKIVSSRGLDKSFKTFEDSYLKDFSEETKELFRELILNTITFHDIGKINPIFQIKNMDNKINKQEEFQQVGSKHSIISSVLYMDFYLDKIRNIDKSEINKIVLFLVLNAYIISKHHSDFDSLESFLSQFEDYEIAYNVIKIFENDKKYFYNREFKNNKLYTNVCNKVKKHLSSKENSDEDNISLYIYEKLLFSLLVASDFYATTEFMSNVEVNDFGDINNIKKFYDVYKNTEISKKIREYQDSEYYKTKDLKKENNINILRTEMFLDAEKELENNISENIFFLEAPTGCGKSNVSMNLSFKLIEKDQSLKKIWYIYPFNTLIEQNMQSLNKVFESDKDVLNEISIVNSISPIKKDISILKNYEGEFEYYSKALLNRQFLNYPIILSTHVSIFKSMFGSTKESIFSFHQLANSVIVLDEIQSYKNIIWTEIITFLNAFAKILNIKVIIMSATLPDLNLLIDSNKNTINLITDREKYFNNHLFKNRVKINYELMDSTDIFEDILKNIYSNEYLNKKILIEFIKKESAYNFYRFIKDKCDFEVELMTGDDNPIERQRILDKVKKLNSIVLVATQVIEAGVDIDMDIGYKDISKLDGEEQFLGRINRSCLREGTVYFFNLDNAENIYSNDIRSNTAFSIKDMDMKEVLDNKKFAIYYDKIFEVLKSNYNNSYSNTNISDFFSKIVGALNFREVENRMKLIDEDNWSMSVYLSSVIFKQNGERIDGKEIWEEYKSLLRNNSMDYAENKVKLSEVRAKMNYFIYEISKNNDLIYNDRIGELYLIEDGETYFKDGKLDKEKFVSKIGVFI